MRKYRNDYPQEPIGGGNPYYQCARCKRSVPSINGKIEGHEEWCEWRKYVELEEEAKALHARYTILEKALRLIAYADMRTLTEDGSDAGEQFQSLANSALAALVGEEK